MGTDSPTSFSMALIFGREKDVCVKFARAALRTVRSVVERYCAAGVGSGGVERGECDGHNQ
jgi:hypothetical protein